MKLSAEIREFLEHGGCCLVVEDGEAKFVISSLKDYLEILRSRGAPPRSSAPTPELVKEINRDIETLIQEEGWEKSTQDPVSNRPKHVFYGE